MRAVRFLLALILGLGLLTWGASLLVHRETSAWFESDVSQRARLAMATARETLVARWSRGQQSELRAALVELTRDERIMGAAACAPDLSLLAATPAFPEPFRCEKLGPLVTSAPEAAPDAWHPWESVERLPGGTVHVSAIPMSDGQRLLGLLVLVHDLSYVERRDALARRFLLLAFFFLSLGAAAVTLVAARLSWRSWSNELRRFLRTGKEPPEFRPLMRDVRALVERIVAERESEGEGGAWTPQRLKLTLAHHLQGERVVIVANREPYIHERTSDGRHPGAAPGERPRDGARAGDARVLRRLGRARQRLRRPRDGRRARPRSGCRPARSRTRSGACGSRRRRSAATTTASPTRGCGRSATSRTRGRSSAARTGEHYQAGEPALRGRGLRRRSTPTTRSSSCRTTTSRWRRG